MPTSERKTVMRFSGGSAGVHSTIMLSSCFQCGCNFPKIMYVFFTSFTQHSLLALSPSSSFWILQCPSFAGNVIFLLIIHFLHDVESLRNIYRRSHILVSIISFAWLFVQLLAWKQICAELMFNILVLHLLDFVTSALEHGIILNLIFFCSRELDIYTLVSYVHCC